MCLSIPVKILKVKGNNKAIADFQGKKKEIDIQLVKNIKKGDYGLVSNGFIIKKVSADEAEEILKILNKS